MKLLFSDRTNLDESLHSAAALNRMQACHYCSILLWNQLHVAFSTVVECIIVSERLALSFFRISITFLLGYDVTLTFPSRLMPLFFRRAEARSSFSIVSYLRRHQSSWKTLWETQNHMLLSYLFNTGSGVISNHVVDTMEQPPTVEGLKNCRHINTEGLVN